MFLNVITKDLNCKGLTKNSVFFERWNEVKDGKF